MRVARFNRAGMAAVFPRQGGHPACYTVADRERILAEARRVPDRERDGTAVWSPRTLRRALRQSGLPPISTATIRAEVRARLTPDLWRVVEVFERRYGSSTEKP